MGIGDLSLTMNRKKDKLPKVVIDETKYYESAYIRGNNKWKATTLVEFCKEKGYEEFDLPLVGIDLSQNCWGSIDTIECMLYHSNRINKADLKYPIILDNYGCIADGYHRLCKAILNGHSTIKAIRMNEMPSPDSTSNNEDK